ncbi:MAG: penicillin-binding protein 2 [Sphingobacteriales bacterium]|nr:MAG: penicillin-binding protein 2 [Sphingobacteriales bacterium]
MRFEGNSRSYILRGIFIVIAMAILGKLMALQLFQPEWKIMANDIAIYRKVVYPPRGVIADRKGTLLCQNVVIYDLMVTPNEVPRKNFDTMGLCRVLGIDTGVYTKTLERVKFINGPMRQGLFMAQLNPGQTARFNENPYAFPGYQLVERTIRSYPKPVGGTFMGYIGEVSPVMLKKDRFSSYSQGDYVGIDGLELYYEEVLRGQRGVHFFERDNFNRPKDRYKRGTLDTTEIAGKRLDLYLDAGLQEYAEKLMQNKIGSAVAIEPSTGGILAMVSSPTYDPNLLRGNERAKNFSKLYSLATKPLFNRAMKGFYPPGSTQKPLTALIALDVGAITPSYGYPCGGGYTQCGRFIGCTHSGGGHAANLRLALANSCNSYFCHLYRLSVDNTKFGGVRKGHHNWYEHMRNFGFGHPLGVDLPFETGGMLFDTSDYDKQYRGPNWNSCTDVYIGMGQGTLAVTPLQMANGMCIIANHGFYYTPHFVKSVGGNPRDSVLAPFLKRHDIARNISDTAYAIVGLGMSDVVTKGTGKVAQLEDIEVCAKTGTVENYKNIGGQRVKLQNHSMFVAFAPRVNPKIAVAVTVENSGYGATWAGPIAALMIQKYLKDSVTSPRHKALEQRMFSGNVISKYTYIIDSQDRYKAKVRDSVKRANKALEAEEVKRQTYLLMRRYLDRWYSKKAA